MSKVTRRKTKISPPMLLGHVLKQLVSGNLWTMVLACLTLSSAFALVVLTHEQRQLHAELEQLNTQRDELYIEWSKLRVEQRVQADLSRLEKIATEDLNMKNLNLDSEIIVKQVKDSD